MKLYLNQDVVIKDFNNKGILINVERARYQKVNGTGLFIASQLKQKNGLTEEEIFSLVSEYYQIPVRLIEDDVKTFIKGLMDVQFIGYDSEMTYEEEADAGNDGNGIWIQVTNGCNLRCKYCYADAGCSENDLTLEEIDTILSQLKEQDFSKIVVTGGEPLLRKDILDILKICSKYGRVQLLTNGIVNDSQLYEKILELVDMVQISLDSYEQGIHDANRGKGSFDKSVKTIQTIAGIVPNKLTIAMTPTPEYMADLAEMIKFCMEHQVQILHINRFVPYGRAHSYEKSLDMREFFKWVDTGYDFLYKKYEEAMKEKKEFIFNLDVASDSRTIVYTTTRKCSCGLNENIISVGYDGSVYLCPSLHVEESKLGNIRQKPIMEIIKEAKEKYGCFDVEHLSECKKCIVRHYCGGGCRALALRYSNDLYGKEENCDAYEERVYDLMLR